MATTDNSNRDIFPIPKSYIYISHLDEGWQYWPLPFYPDTISDTMNSSYPQSTALGRSAPVFTYSNSGPREVQIEIELHRDLVDNICFGNSNATVLEGEDYVDSLIRALQSVAVPKYNMTSKAVEPPLVAIRIVDQVFVRGVLTSGIGITYSKPILSNDKYAGVKLSITISETDPYDAQEIFQNGSFRGQVRTLDAKGLRVHNNILGDITLE